LRVLTFSSSEEKLLKFLKDLDKGIDVSERQSNGKCYKDSFIGSQLITWISTTYLKIERRSALRLCDHFINAGLIEQAEKKKETKFLDDFVIYEKVNPFDILKLKEHTGFFPGIVQLLLFRTFNSNNSSMARLSQPVLPKLTIYNAKMTNSFIQMDGASPRSESDDEKELFKKRLSLDLPRELLIVIPSRRCVSLPVPLCEEDAVAGSSSFGGSSQNLSWKSSSFSLSKGGAKPTTQNNTSSKGSDTPTPKKKMSAHTLQSVSVNTIKTNTEKILVDKKKNAKSVKSIIQAAKTKPEDITYIEGVLSYMNNGRWKKFHLTVKFGVIIVKVQQKDQNVYQMINMPNKATCVPVSVSGRKYCLSLLAGGNTYFFDCKNRPDREFWLNAIINSIEELQRSQRSALQDVKFAGVASDLSGNITEFNEKAEILFGMKKEAVIGKNLKILLPPGLNFLHERFIGTFKKTGERRATGREMNAIILNNDESPVPVSVKHFRLPPMAFQKSAFYVEIKEIGIEPLADFFSSSERVNLKDLFGLKGEASEFISGVYKKMNENFKLIEEKIEKFQLMERVLKEQVDYFKVATEIKKRELDIMQSEIDLFSENSKLDKVMHLLDSENVDFRSFCKSLNCEAAWLFWKEAQSFRTQKSTQKDAIIKEANRIFEKFLDQNSEYKVVVDSEASQYIKEKIQTAEKNVFKSVQKDILFLLEEKVYFQYMDLAEIDEEELDEIDEGDEEDEIIFN
jgi:PAS domain S-box-containing protein